MLQFHFAVLWITIRVVNSRENANKNFNFSREMRELRDFMSKNAFSQNTCMLVIFYKIIIIIP